MKDVIAANEMDTLREHDGYEDLLAGIRREFQKNVRADTGPIFTTNASGLYDLFLQNIPQEARQHYNCNACRHFVSRFGGLVRVHKSSGNQKSLMWSTSTPRFFSDAVKAVEKAVKAAKITGVFITSEKNLGTPITGSWTHMAVEMRASRLYMSRLTTAAQEASKTAEDHRLLCEALKKYRIETVEAAVNLLRSGSMYGSDQVIGAAEWLLDTMQEVKAKKKNSYNLLWHRSATAPAGFCHVSSNMIGTLLDDIQAGYSSGEVSRRFSEKMHPLQYQRPQAAPSAGNVVQAEKIVEKLGIENSLKRRFARLDELEAVWSRRPEKTANTGGVFSNVRTKESVQRGGNGLAAPEVTMTWEKFQRTVLPSAKKIEFLVTGKLDSFGAIVTAEDPSAPPIIQWDTEEQRCPFNWYVYSNGSYPGNWGLARGYADVTAVVLQPNMWQPGYEHHGNSVFFILEGAKDHDYKDAGIALFPSILKSELREVRSTIESFSKTAVLGGYDEASACGIRLQGSCPHWETTFRITTDVGVTIYHLDRWD